MPRPLADRLCSGRDLFFGIETQTQCLHSMVRRREITIYLVSRRLYLGRRALFFHLFFVRTRWTSSYT